MTLFFDTDRLVKKPIWQKILDDTPERTIRETKLTRQQLENALKIIVDYHENKW